MPSFSTSERFKLGLADVVKILRLAIVAALGAGLNEIVAQVSNYDFGNYQAIASTIGIVVGASVVETLRRWITDFSQG